MHPTIIFATNGYVTDNWEDGLREAEKNSWFTKAVKDDITVQDEADGQIVASIVENKEAVMPIDTAGEALRRLFRDVFVEYS